MEQALLEQARKKMKMICLKIIEKEIRKLINKNKSDDEIRTICHKLNHLVSIDEINTIMIKICLKIIIVKQIKNLINKNKSDEEIRRMYQDDNRTSRLISIDEINTIIHRLRRVLNRPADRPADRPARDLDQQVRQELITCARKLIKLGLSNKEVQAEFKGFALDDINNIRHRLRRRASDKPAK